MIIVASSVGAQIVPSERLQHLMDKERTLVIAHRGFKFGAPENTLPAFELALLARADLVELDYFHSADGIPIVMHDRTLDRTTNSAQHWGAESIEVESKTLAQLRELDAGSWFNPIFSGTVIPTLEESLDLIQPESITLVERKRGDPQTLVTLLKEKDMLNDVIVQAFDWEFLAGCHEKAPGIVLGALGPPRQPDGRRYPMAQRVLSDTFLDRIEASGAQFIGWSQNHLTQEAIAEAHQRGLKVWVYTVNELDAMLRFLEMGVDGIISDNTALVWKALTLHYGEWPN